jgi:hypothetical protein
MSEASIPVSSNSGKKKVLNEFVQSLTKSQPVSLSYYRNVETKAPDEAVLRQALKNNFIIVRFVNTGTELGMSLKTDDPQFYATIDGETLTINGRLKLDYTAFKMTASINIKTYEGTGFLAETEDWCQKKS